MQWNVAVVGEPSFPKPEPLLLFPSLFLFYNFLALLVNTRTEVKDNG